MTKHLLVLCLIILFSSTAFSQSNYSETLTISTYYPAPYGVYRVLKANRFVVGGATLDPYPSASFDGALTFRPTTIDASETAPKGTLFFDDSTNTFKYYDGSAWVNLIPSTPATPTPATPTPKTKISVTITGTSQSPGPIPIGSTVVSCSTDNGSDCSSWYSGWSLGGAVCSASISGNTILVSYSASPADCVVRPPFAATVVYQY